MAILLEEKQQFNWKALIIFLVIIAAVFGLAYFLFFAPSPVVQEIIPSSVKSTAELSTVNLNPNDLLGNATYKSLKQYGGPVAAPQVGRENPFIKF